MYKYYEQRTGGMGCVGLGMRTSQASNYFTTGAMAR